MHRENTALFTYLTRLRRNPLFARCEFVFIIEANAAWTRAKEICLFVHDRFPPCTLVTDQKPGGANAFRPGVWVGPDDKDRFVSMTSDFLKTGNIRLLDQFCAGTSDPETILTMLKQQMLKYRRKPKPVADHSTTSKKSGIWSGKDKSGHMKDDMCMSLIQCLYHAACFMSDPLMTHPFPPQFISALGAQDKVRKYDRASVSDVQLFDPAEALRAMQLADARARASYE
jgi:hypothetical protein